MSKKVKCIECEHNMNWATPNRVVEENLDYAELCLSALKNTLVCGWTMKTKGIKHEQYCKHYRKKKEKLLQLDEDYRKEKIKELEKMICKISG